MIRTDLDEQEKLVDQTFQILGMFPLEKVIQAILVDDKDYLAKARVVAKKHAAQRDSVIDELRNAVSDEDRKRIMGACSIPESIKEATESEILSEKQKMGSVV